MRQTIIVIPAEGDAPETEERYVEALKRHFEEKRKQAVRVLVFRHRTEDTCSVMASTKIEISDFLWRFDFEKAEIHAQGGLGAYVACEFLRVCPERIARVFMVGGAPCDAMTGIAKFFHRKFVRFWYRIQWAVPFFADDPNPEKDAIIEAIKVSSTATMQRNPELYREQLLLLGRWRLPEDWQAPEGCEVFFVPNGEAVRLKWWDNTYNDQKARVVWRKHGARITAQPGRHFSFYSMMPAEALFEVMDEVR